MAAAAAIMTEPKTATGKLYLREFTGSTPTMLPGRRINKVEVEGTLTF